MDSSASSFFDKLPGIIDASAKSPLALAALIILVLGFLAFFYFREAKESTRIVIFIVIGIGAFTLLAALLTTPATGPAGRPSAPEPVPAPAANGGGKGAAPGGEVTQPEVVLGIPALSQGIATPLGFGMGITVPGKIKKAEGRTAQLVVNFNFANGAPVWANPQEPRFRTTDGVVATGSAPFTVTSDSFDLGAINTSIPYHAFNMVPTGGSSRADMILTASLFLDGAVAARSEPVPFFFYW